MDQLVIVKHSIYRWHGQDTKMARIIHTKIIVLHFQSRGSIDKKAAKA